MTTILVILVGAAFLLLGWAINRVLATWTRAQVEVSEETVTPAHSARVATATGTMVITPTKATTAQASTVTTATTIITEHASATATAQATTAKVLKIKPNRHPPRSPTKSRTR